MLRKIVCAGFVLAVTFTLAAAGEFTAVIHKVDGNNVTFSKVKKGEKGAEQTLPAAANVKVISGGKFNKDDKKFEGGEALTGGLSNAKLKNVGEKGVFARITTDADDKQITEIRLLQFKGKKKKNAE